MSAPSRRSRRRYRKVQNRRVWVFSELNHDLKPETVARIITAAGLEQARRESGAQAERAEAARSIEGEEDDHA